MRSVDPVSFTAAESSVASLPDTACNVETGGGASGAATDVGSDEGTEECKLAGVDSAGIVLGNGSGVETSVILASSVTSAIGSGVGTGTGLGVVSVSGTGVGSDTVSDLTGVVCDCFGGIAGTVFRSGKTVGADAEIEFSSGVFARLVVASVSCRSRITSRSFPLLLSALPVLPAPESTSSWAKLSILSKILSRSAPSSSSPATP